MVDAEEVGEEAEEGGQKNEGQSPAVGVWEEGREVESGHFGA